MEAKEIDNLRKLALEATQGNWVPFLGSNSNTFAIGLKDKSVDQVIAWSGFDGSHEPKKKQKANCEYIAAANPRTMLYLLDELEACRLQLSRAER